MLHPTRFVLLLGVTLSSVSSKIINIVGEDYGRREDGVFGRYNEGFPLLDKSSRAQAPAESNRWWPFPSTTTPNPFPSPPPPPPPKDEVARMARYIAHYSNWCIIAHISHHGNTTGYPAARVYSTADGYYNTSTGVLYFYVSKMDAHIADLSRDGRCSVTMSLAEGDYCHQQGLDPEDPRCAQIILTGHFIFLDPKSAEYALGKNYLFERHPVMKTWPDGHGWNVAKLKIGYIQVADNFGGSAYPTVEEYFAAKI